MDINYFMKIQNAYCTSSKREKDLHKVNIQMDKHFEDTFGTKDVLLNGNPFKLMIIRDTDGNTYKKKIKSPHDDKFNLGDYIEWNGQVWLVTLIDSDDDTWNRGYMYQCNILLRWQNAKGEIIERWAYSEDFTKYSTGSKGNNTITLGDYQYGVTLPVDNETKIIKRDKRFPIDIEGIDPPDTYKLTNRKVLLTDNRSFGRGGILTWTLSYDEFNPTTDKQITLPNNTQVWICDYKEHIVSEPTTPPQDETTILSANISGRKELKVGFSRTYTVTISDKDGNALAWDDTMYGWNVVSDFDIEQTVTGNKIKLFVDDESFIGSSFLLQVIKLDDNAVIGEIEITVMDVV